jgi:hypothetical protein
LLQAAYQMAWLFMDYAVLGATHFASLGFGMCFRLSLIKEDSMVV